MPLSDCFRIGTSTVVYPHQNRIQCDNQITRIEPRLMTLLLCLVEEPATVVSRATLLDAVWPEGYGTDEGLTKAISGLRRALGDSARDAQIIETIPKRGYRLVAPVQHPVTDSQVPAPERSPVLSKSTPLTRRVAPLWVAVALLAIGLAGQWLYIVQDTPPEVERQLGDHTVLNHTKDIPISTKDSLRTDAFFGSTFFF